jgi:hypothetical protein
MKGFLVGIIEILEDLKIEKLSKNQFRRRNEKIAGIFFCPS